MLFGAGQGTTLGSYAPRVSNFLATLAPDIGQAKDKAGNVDAGIAKVILSLFHNYVYARSSRMFSHMM